MRYVTDANGKLLGTQDYSAYGAIVSRSGVTGQLGYAGMWQHETSGLNLTWYRPYNPRVGRWLSRDPIGEEGGLNLFGYVNGSPLSLTDPSGLRPLTEREKKCLSPYIPEVDLGNADVHDGEVPWYLGKDYDGITRGNDIYFRPGVYDGNTATGIALLGHELIHVGQYRNGMNWISYTWSTRNGYAESPYEQEAYAKQRQILMELTKANGGCGCNQ